MSTRQNAQNHPSRPTPKQSEPPDFNHTSLTYRIQYPQLWPSLLVGYPDRNCSRAKRRSGTWGKFLCQCQNSHELVARKHQRLALNLYLYLCHPIISVKICKVEERSSIYLSFVFFIAFQPNSYRTPLLLPSISVVVPTVLVSRATARSSSSFLLIME